MNSTISVSADVAGSSSRILVWQARAWDSDAQRPLVAELHGAILVNSNSHDGLPAQQLSVRHASMTDYEHDATILVDLQLKGFTFLEVRPGFIRFAAIIGPDPRAWPAGSGPETFSTCTDKMCRGDHPIGPYMPPEVLEVNKLAGVEVLVDILRT